jgi:hypothetical protein
VRRCASAEESKKTEGLSNPQKCPWTPMVVSLRWPAARYCGGVLLGAELNCFIGAGAGGLAEGRRLVR